MTKEHHEHAAEWSVWAAAVDRALNGTDPFGAGTIDQMLDEADEHYRRLAAIEQRSTEEELQLNHLIHGIVWGDNGLCRYFAQPWNALREEPAEEVEKMVEAYFLWHDRLMQHDGAPRFPA